MASAEAWAFNGGLEAELPAGSRGRASGQVRGKAPLAEAEALLVLGHSMEAANLHTFLEFGNAKKSDFVLSLPKNSRWPQNWRGLEQNWGPVPPPRPGLKPPLTKGQTLNEPRLN